MRRRLFCLAWLPAMARAADAPSALGGLLQVCLGLAVVLGLILGVAWLFRRLSGGMLGVGNRLKVVSGVMVGQRERVVIVEVEGEWLVVGVTAHAVNLLDKMPKPEGATEAAIESEPFARWMQQALEKARQPRNRNRP